MDGTRVTQETSAGLGTGQDHVSSMPAVCDSPGTPAQGPSTDMQGKAEPTESGQTQGSLWRIPGGWSWSLPAKIHHQLGIPWGMAGGVPSSWVAERWPHFPRGIVGVGERGKGKPPLPGRTSARVSNSALKFESFSFYSLDIFMAKVTQ